jgi:hypothetical protein
MPADYEHMATSYSQDYRNTNDNFRKHDLLAALTPKLDVKIADAKVHSYLVWEDSSPDLGHYDFSRKGFPVNTPLFSDGGFGYMSDSYGWNSQIGFSNGGGFRFLPIADETRAREIEDMIGKYDAHLALKIFAFAQSTDDNRHAIMAQIVKIQLLGAGDRVLAEQRAP